MYYVVTKIDYFRITAHISKYFMVLIKAVFQNEQIYSLKKMPYFYSFTVSLMLWNICQVSSVITYVITAMVYKLVVRSKASLFFLSWEK